MPLRLARYGVPLAETAPSGLAAAGIEAPILFTLERVPDPVQPEGSALEAAADGEQEVAELEESEPRPVQVPAAAPERVLGPRNSSEDAAERFAGAYQEFIAQFQVEPTAAQWAFWLRDQYGISTGASDPLSEAQLQPLLQVLQNRIICCGDHRRQGAAADRSVLVRLLLQRLAQLRAGARRLPRCWRPRGVRVRAGRRHRRGRPTHLG